MIYLIYAAIWTLGIFATVWLTAWVDGWFYLDKKDRLNQKYIDGQRFIMFSVVAWPVVLICNIGYLLYRLGRRLLP